MLSTATKLSLAAALGFDAAFTRTEAEIESGLVTRQRAFTHYHRIFVGHYPYNLYYRPTEHHAVIVELLYARFSPARIEPTLRERE